MSEARNVKEAAVATGVGH